ncbi:G-type lectin S-receptor-like serine/threonine-protein kinase At1g34300 [Eucalyptus grandis]|uniref:G-type lectin S-receptor-like serine/threonine-protein kinase At1g34300 n=1 Tax=Eucalyptus grandis TaxID=71139 RepID=UPI00192F0553|nr:G-type lectin S-receptor-like serine/threonine-protein kinase At1g34300 [Eucalyptus grandis]
MSLSLLLLPLLLAIPPPQSALAQAANISSFSSSDPPWLPGQGQILLSPNATFAAGFQPLHPNASSAQYTFSVWYYGISPVTVVWSANPNSTVDASASLVVTPGGQLFLNSSGAVRWARNATAAAALSLGDNGNLMFGAWESFSSPGISPGDTFLPSQNMNETTLVSKNGRFSFDSETLTFNGTEIYWTSPDKNKFLNLDDSGKISQENGQSILSADFGDHSVLRRLTLGDDGNLRLLSYSQGEWTMVWQAMPELCKIHGLCGRNSICMGDGAEGTYCVCPPGFRSSADGNYKCERKVPVASRQKAKFLRLDFVNFTGGLNQTNLQVANFSDCRAKCLADQTCEGFMFNYDGTGFCVLQLERLLYGYWSPGATANAMFLMVDQSETDTTNFTGLTSVLETTCPVNVTLPFPPDESSTTTRNIAIICTLFAAELISGMAFFWAFLKKYIKYRNMAQTLGLELLPAGGPKRFTLAEIKAATKGFLDPIGRGGFGDVYKGELSDKRVVAVKCLKNVAGGDAEFWAEVTIIARMHHLNLVRLWGFCAEKGQRILVYEYVPNGSLDKFLFRSSRATDQSETGEAAAATDQKPMLDWGVRYRIALGVARAIAYLHEECLEWVLHCDIKPENILLGDDFCPKISDFGLAKLRKKEDMVSMSRIRGTRGYMAPEWVKTDQITPKADVYSFGMVLLEIVSGVRNFEMQGSRIESEDWYFPGWAFDKAFKEMKVEDILDRQIKHAYDDKIHFKLVDRMVKTAMWCLQDRPELRPSMGKVAKMLEGTVEIMEPRKPTIFYLGDE